MPEEQGNYYLDTLRALGQRLVPGGEPGRFPWEAQAAPPPPPPALAVAPPRQAPQRTGLSDQELADIMEIEQMVQAGMSGQDPAPFTVDERRGAWAQDVFDSTRPVNQNPQTVHEWRFGEDAPPPQQQYRQAPSQRRDAMVESGRRRGAGGMSPQQQRELEEEIVALLSSQGGYPQLPPQGERVYQDPARSPRPEEIRAILDQIREEEAEEGGRRAYEQWQMDNAPGIWGR